MKKSIWEITNALLDMSKRQVQKQVDKNIPKTDVGSDPTIFFLL